MFAWLTFSANKQYFLLTTNQPMVLSAMAYQSNEQDVGYRKARGIPLQLGRSIQGRRRGSNTIDKGQNNLDDPQRRLISTDFRR